MINILQNPIRPELPKVMERQPLNIYVPAASTEAPGIASYNKDHFEISAGRVSLREDCIPDNEGLREVRQVVGTDTGLVLETESKNLIGAVNEIVKTGGGEASKELLNRVGILEKQVYGLTYTPIAFTMAEVTPSLVEMGNAVTAGVRWGLNKAPKTQKLDGVEIDPSARVYFTPDPVSKTTTWRLEVTDDRDVKVQRNVTLTFANGIYYGVSKVLLENLSNAEDLTETVNASLSKVLSTRKLSSFSVNAQEGEYIYYLIPARLGECTFSMDGFPGGFELVKKTSFVNGSGFEETYYIYKSDWPNLGECTVVVS